MATMTISYAAKHRGDLWTATDANEIKEVVNNNAAELDNQAQVINNINGDIDSIERNLSTLNGRTAQVAQTAQSVTIQPNVLNRWASPVNALNIMLAAGTTGVQNEYMLEFTVSGNGFTLTLNDNVRWFDEPRWENGHTYQVSILNGLAIAAGWEAASS